MTNPFKGFGARKRKQPKMRHHAGRTWDNCYVITPQGDRIKAHLDTTWGSYAYFEYDGQWYRIRMDFYTDVSKGDYVAVFDMSTYETEKQRLNRMYGKK